MTDVTNEIEPEELVTPCATGQTVCVIETIVFLVPQPRPQQQHQQHHQQQQKQQQHRTQVPQLNTQVPPHTTLQTTTHLHQQLQM